MWITCPHLLWINAYLSGCFVDIVDEMWISIVEKWITVWGGVENVEKLSTVVVDKFGGSACGGSGGECYTYCHCG
jgi:hypothetical protein